MRRAWRVPPNRGEDAGCGGGDDAEDPGDREASVAEAMDVAHDRGERGVIDTGQRGSLDERAQNTSVP
jgi:hypothetical protein